MVSLCHIGAGRTTDIEVVWCKIVSLLKQKNEHQLLAGGSLPVSAAQ
jgi:hypothetical protein